MNDVIIVTLASLFAGCGDAGPDRDPGAALPRVVGDRWGNRLAVVELGAGTAIPTVGHQCELRSRRLIRINPREPTLCRTVS